MTEKYKQQFISEQAPIKRFARKVVIDKATGCWNWTGCTSHGYGVIGINKKQLLVHRYSYEYHYGHILAGALITHKCNNKLCVNPEHLQPGNHHSNAIDFLATKGLIYQPKTAKEIKEQPQIRRYRLVQTTISQDVHTVLRLKALRAGVTLKHYLSRIICDYTDKKEVQLEVQKYA
jgi:hypothetical protein